MNYLKLAAIVFITITSFLHSGCSSATLRPEAKVTVYRLDGSNKPSKMPNLGTESFYGYPILETKTLNVESQSDLVDFLNDTGSYDSANRTKCFWPGFGVKVLDGATTQEFAFCFKCNNVQVYTNGESRPLNQIDKDAMPEIINLYNTIFSDHQYKPAQ